MFVHERLAEGVLKHKFRLEELERGEEEAKHVRAVGGRSWALVAFVVVVAVLFLIFQVSVPSDPVILGA